MLCGVVTHKRAQCIKTVYFIFCLHKHVSMFIHLYASTCSVALYAHRVYM